MTVSRKKKALTEKINALHKKTAHTKAESEFLRKQRLKESRAHDKKIRPAVKKGYLRGY
jgi:hypothetical protein